MKTKIILAIILITVTGSLGACNSNKTGETAPNLRQDAVTTPQAGTQTGAQIARGNPPNPNATPSELDGTPSNTKTEVPQSEAESAEQSEATVPSQDPTPETGDRPSKPAQAFGAQSGHPAQGDGMGATKPSQPSGEATDERALTPANSQSKLKDVQFGAVQYLSSEAIPDQAIEATIHQSMPEAEGTRYYYNRIDLSGDGKPEALVYLVGSYTCGTGGCQMMVMQPQGQGYKVVSEMSLVNAPVLVASETTAGWNDLVIPVAGGGASAHYARLQFDGSSYPANPSTAPEVVPNSTLNGTAVITDATGGEGGIQLGN